MWNWVEVICIYVVYVYVFMFTREMHCYNMINIMLTREMQHSNYDYGDCTHYMYSEGHGESCIDLKAKET